jgi:hypothetical protein
LLRIVGVLFGVAFASVGGFGMRAGLDSRGWPAAPATVLSSEVIGMGDHTSSRIVAEFKVGADFYHCGQVRLGRENLPQEARAFPVGARVSVHYDPKHMARCVLIPGVSGASLLFAASGVVFLGLAIFAHLRLRVELRATPYASLRSSVHVVAGRPKPPSGWRRVAERGGFEPPIPLRVCRISSAVLSTAQPPLQACVERGRDN